MTGGARRVGSWVRSLAGLTVLAIVAHQVGSAPFLAGLSAVSPLTILVAVGLTAASTAACVWRWQRVARELGTRLPWRDAFVAYYRSQFLDATLPGGVLGDVYRGVLYGRVVQDMGRALRSVLWERALGQAAQCAVALGVLCLLASPVRRAAVCAAAVLAVLLVFGVIAVRAGACPAWLKRPWTAEVARLAWRAGPVIVLSSTLALAGYVAIFVVAAWAAGTTAALPRVLPLALLALVASAVPLNFAGFGPREGMAAWVFGAAGLGSAAGVAAGVLYGVLGLVACLPGAFILLADGVRAARRD